MVNSQLIYEWVSWSSVYLALKIGLNYDSKNLSREPRRQNLWIENKEQMAWPLLLSKQFLFLAPCQHCLEGCRLRLKYESDDILMDFLLNFLLNHNWIFHFIRLAHTKCFPCYFYFLWDRNWVFNWICFASPNSLLIFLWASSSCEIVFD